MAVALRNVVAGMLACLLGVVGCEETDEPTVAAPAASDESAASPSTIGSTVDPIVAEVLDNIRNQPVGAHTLADYDLPEPFLRRLADRIIRGSFLEQRYRVVNDTGEPVPPDRSMPPPVETTPAGPPALRVVEAEVPGPILAARRAVVEERPALRGYRAPILDHATDILEPRFADDGPAEFVARTLARDGLPATLAGMVDGMTRDDPGLDAHEVTTRLETAGFPVDLLRYFSVPGPPPPVGDAVVAYAVALVEGGRRGRPLVETLTSLPFHAVSTHAGFRVSTESGEHAFGTMRLQLTRGTYWQAVGAGGGLDVARQLVEALPDVDFTISIERRFLEPFLATAGEWNLGPEERLTLLVEPLTVSQWAQDNGKAGTVPMGGSDEGRREPATLVPRYASRRDDGSLFVPGESFLVDTLAATGHVVIHSPLLFQGGNLLAVHDPVRDERLLLVGEAEIHRNTALGLTAAQASEAFRVELGVDRVVVLPSVAFHLDYDVSVRASARGVTAFVNDPVAAADVILACGLDALEAGDALEPAAAETARRRLAEGNRRGVVDVIGPMLANRMDANGRFPLSFARLFAAGPADSPIGNLERFLLAMDIASSAGTDETLGREGTPMRSYLEAFRRAEAGRRLQHDALRDLGWTVVAVPSLAEGKRSINAINGIHDANRYLLPAYGGLYAPLDAAATRVFETHLGPDVAVIPILCGESQRRSGALHCSVSVFPRFGRRRE